MVSMGLQMQSAERDALFIFLTFSVLCRFAAWLRINPDETPPKTSSWSDVNKQKSLESMNKKARPTFTASGRTSVRVQNSTAAVLVRLFTLWTFCCGFAAGVDNTSSIFSEVKSSFTASASVLLVATSVYSSQSVQVNSSTENGKFTPFVFNIGHNFALRTALLYLFLACKVKIFLIIDTRYAVEI